MRTYKLNILLVIIFGFSFASCSGFLDEKPSKTIVVPKSVEDLQSILNAVDGVNISDSFGLILSDDIFITDDGLLALPDNIRDGYLWKRQLSDAQGSMPTWSFAYGNIFKFNVVLEEAEKITPADEAEKSQLDRIKGAALYLRSQNYFELLQIFTHPVISQADLGKDGVPLMLTPDFSAPKGKSTVGEVYDQIIEDLIKALDLLPEVPVDALRPSKVASYGLLARIYLQLGGYDQALNFANQALSIKSDLMNLNSNSYLSNLPITLYTYPIPRFNEEVVLHILAGSQSYMYSNLTFVNQVVYDSYDENDIRKYLYFTAPDQLGRVNFAGNFSGEYLVFAGITTGELYLIKAEALARKEREEEALQTLNILLESRFYEDTFIPYTAENVGSVLKIVLEERRKEMIYRGILRWTDMRRFLKDQNWSGVSPRVVEGVTYDLGTSPENYFLEIPLNEQERNKAL
ncbi:RagB/SusD family nutrient uptake outer membrane protein [Algoriphagus yeomjeoni]|uniref:RagB/SusD family nutrient uptake outer membrane protein n=1 Tax=Algoriphagus yeomjeoni TaxID=291403 RepID=UPI003CE5A2AA